MVPTVTFRLVFVLVLLADDRRRIRRVAVTAHPFAGLDATAKTISASAEVRPRLLGDQPRHWAINRMTERVVGVFEEIGARRAISRGAGG